MPAEQRVLKLSCVRLKQRFCYKFSGFNLVAVFYRTRFMAGIRKGFAVENCSDKGKLEK